MTTIRVLFSIFEKGQETPPPSPSRYAPALSTAYIIEGREAGKKVKKDCS